MTQANLLLVEDDDVDAEAVERALHRNAMSNPFHRAKHGEEALAILRSRPHDEYGILVLLDLNLPRMNGFEFLQELRSDPVLTDTVVFVVTTSDDDSDRAAAYREHVAGYVVKSSLDSFNGLIEMLRSYCAVVTLP